ncbi:AAA family ATPase [bacterium]|nr:AAA family ATPase [bacterium]
MALRPRPYLQQVLFRPDTPVDPKTYPYSIPAVRDIEKLAFHPDVTFLVGENGSGKSTVLEAIALLMGFGPEGGTRNVNFATTGFAVSPLHESLRSVKSHVSPKDGYFLRAESFYNIATYMDETGYLGGYGGKSLHHRSHGEAFMTLLTHKFRGRGLYLLDEPEAALSPQRQLAAMVAIRDLVGRESQFVIATHSPILLAYPGAKIWSFDDSGISEIAYEETDHFLITRDFLNHHRQRIQRLFEA